KRKQIAQMINSESKRLARMIQTFLDVERLSEGQIEIKQETFEAKGLVRGCLERVQSLAERKNIHIDVDGAIECSVHGDRELMEYAIYNLLTNAIKYSPPDTHVSVGYRPEAGNLRISIQ